MLSKISSTAIAALLAAAVTAAAHAAQPDPDVVTVRVFVADLNLASLQGAAVALRRIRQAAGAICGEQPSTMDLKRLALYHACMRSTVSQAVASLNNPLVTAQYSGRASTPPELASR
jgi:UrcA family protein